MNRPSTTGRAGRPVPVSELDPVAYAAAEVRLVAERMRAMRVVFLVGFGLIVIGQFRPLASYFFSSFPWITSGLGALEVISATVWAFKWRRAVIKSDEKKLAYVFGIVFVVVLLLLALAVPNPTAFQYLVFRIVLALAAAGVASMFPGFLQVTVPKWVRATGALAIFVIVFFWNPAALVAPSVPSQSVPR
jgi:hypothetical protein